MRDNFPSIGQYARPTVRAKVAQRGAVLAVTSMIVGHDNKSSPG
jgi:hypothetical protein